MSGRASTRSDVFSLASVVNVVVVVVVSGCRRRRHGNLLAPLKLIGPRAASFVSAPETISFCSNCTNGHERNESEAEFSALSLIFLLNQKYKIYISPRSRVLKKQ